MSCCQGTSSNRQKTKHTLGWYRNVVWFTFTNDDRNLSFFVSYYIFAWFIMECCILARTQVLDRLIYVLRWLMSEINSCCFWGLQTVSPASYVFLPLKSVYHALNQMSVILQSLFQKFGASKNSWNR